MSRKPLVAGNWKMNGDPALVSASATVLRGAMASGLGCDVLLCPPAPLLMPLNKAFEGTPLAVGAQNASEHRSGAYTGEVSSWLLSAMGVSHVILGHSERRALFGESSDTVAAKVRQALDAGLTAIVCVGETLAERQSEQTQAVLDSQLAPVFARLSPGDWSRVVIAYEPVWAIGTGVTASPQQAQEVHAHLRARIGAVQASAAVTTRIIYGGSVKSASAAGLFACPDIDGGLVGGGSLDPLEFLAICRAAATKKD